jgi:hypothetical protein
MHGGGKAGPLGRSSLRRWRKKLSRIATEWPGVLSISETLGGDTKTLYLAPLLGLPWQPDTLLLVPTRDFVLTASDVAESVLSAIYSPWLT